MKRPPYGLCWPVKYQRCVDGDTIAVSLFGGDIETHIRLLDCWCDDKAPVEQQRAAKQYAEKLMEQCVRPVVWVPLDMPIDKPVNVLRLITSMSRLLGHVFVSESTTLSECMVAAGHATKEKEKP